MGIQKQFSDEFYGNELDATKWHGDNPNWPGGKPSMANTKNVVVKNGHLVLRVDKLNEPFNSYTHSVGCVISKKSITYGYFILKCELN
ncbi:hypothetical protein [Thalassobellus suaedae]|uniref:Uncharacterized protein n=1 Tax=Thalassobellus suaedae TaxID=3074124 RepID=A0ABY9Y218_9FLAO|nr:hypothetical protein RHP49_13630 [Flavobacteriaceae bacterium HL-DH10]